MKILSAELQAHYASGSTTIATCWKATLLDGTVVAATSHDSDLVYLGTTYQSIAAYNASTIETGSQLNPDNLELEGFLRAPGMTDTDLHSGKWDHAFVEIFEVNYNDLSMGDNAVRHGRLGEVRAGRSKVLQELRGLTQAYSRKIVRLMQELCNADLGDTRCKVDLLPFTQTFTVQEVTEDYLIVNSSLINPANWFTGGKATFTSGANEGIAMEVKRSTGSQLELVQRMPFPVEVGDTFTVYAGCMKRREDCIGKFNNLLNFRGFSFLPGSAVYGGPGTVMPKGGSIVAPPAPAPTPSPGAPSPAPAPAPVPTDPGDYVDTTSYVSLEAGIAAAGAAGKALRIPANTTVTQNGVQYLDGVLVFGEHPTTSVINATDSENTAFFLQGDGAGLMNLKIQGAVHPSRLAAWEATRITIDGATNFVIEGVTIVGSSAAGIQTKSGASGGTITNNTISDTNADSIHITDGASNIEIDFNVIQRAGDDGIAVVSYQGDSATCSQITARNNRVLDNVGGRNMSVVGGSTIVYQNNFISGNSAGNAGLYIAQEENVDFQTRAVSGVIAQYNTIEDVGSDGGHAAVMIFADSSEGVTNVHAFRNDVIQGNEDAFRFFGTLTNIRLDRNKITGPGEDYSGAPHAGVTITPWTEGAVGYVAPAPAPAPTPAPAPAGDYPTITTSGAYENTFLETGLATEGYWIEDNRWGQGGITSFMQQVGRTNASQLGPNGEVAARLRWSWPNPAGSREVKGYPAILYGRKPGYYGSGSQPGGKLVQLIDGSISTRSPSGWTPGTFLPQRLPLTTPIYAHSNHSWIANPTGRGHLSYDIWLQSHPNQDYGFNASSITHEIMIPLEHWGGYGSVSQRGIPQFGTFTSDGITFRRYKVDGFGYLDGSYGRSSWKFVVYEAEDADMPIKQALTLSNFFNDTRSMFPVTGSEYVASIELGVEPEEGTGDLVIHDYRVYR